MKNFLSIVALSLVVSMSAYAKVYIDKELNFCEPRPKDINDSRMCDMDNVPITGLLKEFNSNGDLASEVNYKVGKPEGLAKYYYESGDLASEVNYKDGKLEGLLKEYYENGNLESVMNFKNDKVNGIHKTYYENGNLKSELNSNDKPEGLVKIYYKNGNLEVEVNFKDGKPVSGYLYDINGKRTKMTNAHIHKNPSC